MIVIPVLKVTIRSKQQYYSRAEFLFSDVIEPERNDKKPRRQTVKQPGGVKD